MKPAELWDRAVCVLYPPRCVLCGEVVRYNDTLCDRCACKTDAMVMPADGPLLGIAAPFAYAEGLRFAVHTIKEYRDRRTLCFLAGPMSQLVREQWDVLFDLVVPVPASRAAMRRRGYNQAASLAGEVGALLGIQLETGVLGRRNRAAVQHDLSAEERRKNAAAAYTLRDGGKVRGKTVLLVDDVYTTGATLQACAGLLAGAGADVYGVTATYTPMYTQT